MKTLVLDSDPSISLKSSASEKQPHIEESPSGQVEYGQGRPILSQHYRTLGNTKLRWHSQKASGQPILTFSKRQSHYLPLAAGSSQLKKLLQLKETSTDVGVEKGFDNLLHIKNQQDAKATALNDHAFEKAAQEYLKQPEQSTHHITESRSKSTLPPPPPQVPQAPTSTIQAAADRNRDGSHNKSSKTELSFGPSSSHGHKRKSHSPSSTSQPKKQKLSKVTKPKKQKKNQAKHKASKKYKKPLKMHHQFS